MALIKSYEGIHPDIHHTVTMAENATIVGDVVIGEDSNIWYQAVLRGDVGPIRIGKRSNIQDASMLHCTKGLSTCEVGDDVVIGHRVILHGCRIESASLIGMGAIVLDGAVVESGCIIGAGALVPQNMRCESGWIYAGIPAKKVKPLDDQHYETIRSSAIRYVGEGKKHFK